jgi:hypothetical protein
LSLSLLAGGNALAQDAAQPGPQVKKGLNIDNDVALMSGYVPGTGGIGGGLVFEPKIEVIDNLRVGLRTAISITGGGSIDSASDDVSVGMGVNISALS